MDVEHEICGNCKKEIPQVNYVMHTAHCARNISLCPACKEPFPKNQIDGHRKSCTVGTKHVAVKKPETPASNLERSQYFQERKSVEDKKIATRKEREMQKYERLVDTGYSLKETTGSINKVSSNYQNKNSAVSPASTNKPQEPARSAPSSGAMTNGSMPKIAPSVGQSNGALPRKVVAPPAVSNSNNSANKLLACKFCELELPKLDLEEHENYCGTRTDRCEECGELVMFKNKQVHLDSNHGFIKLKDEPGPRPSWDSPTRRSTSTSDFLPRTRPSPLRFTNFDTTLYSFPSTYNSPTTTTASNKDKGESYKEISRRLDLGPAPQPPRGSSSSASRRRNPPTELIIPCEFCDTPIPHDDLIRHETGCRPDLARLNPRRRSPEPDDDYFVAPAPNSPDVELPCEFCADMIPASQLLRHQATCN